ncbi:MAG: hypothetical protein E7240_02510 [Lachnospiraceae bacterium]|nr:hypothetical protein [Lachnospiraceae bacterium]
MKKSRKALTFTAAMMTAAMLSACHETVYGPPPETVYGPPEDYEESSVVIETVKPSYDPGDDIPEDVYGPPPEEDDYDDDIPETVYGPPEDFEPVSPEDSSADPAKEESKAESSITAVPTPEEESIPETVYGPPEWFEPEEEIPEDVYGPPGDF